MKRDAFPRLGDERAADLGRDLDAIQPLIHAVEVALADLGVPVAPLYLASARGSLSRAARYVARNVVRSGEELVEGSGLTLREVRGTPGVGSRFREVAGGRLRDPAADLGPRIGGPDLGADLVRSEGCLELCRGPVGSALLADALARERWLHLATGAKWSTDASGARALVSAVVDGAGFPTLSSLDTRGLVDGEVVALVRSLGWSRLLSPSMPGDG